MDGHELTRRSLIRWGVAGLGAVAVPGLLSACGSSSDSTAPTTTAATAPTDSLLDAARSEHELNLIAISDSPDSAYRTLLEGFKKYSALKLNLTEPAAGSGIELAKVQSLEGKSTQPDVIDVGLSSALKATDKGLLAVTRPDGWNDIPSAAKDAEGHWFSSYYGLVGIVSNSDLVHGSAPKSLDDLTKLGDGVTIGFPGDPRTTKAAGNLASGEAFAAVWTVALANGGSLDDIGPGIDFLADLANKGILDATELAIPETVGAGKVAVTLLNTFEYARAKGLLQSAKPGSDLELHIAPSDSLYPNYYAQGAVKGSPHPHAAELWLGYLLSDDGAKAFLEGGAVPTRFPVLSRQGTITESDLGHFTSIGVTADQLAAVRIPTIDQVNAAQNAVNERWGPDVLGKK